MPDIRGVWGIDIGLAGLKAIRLVYTESAKRVLATAFDYVPHPKILSQPDANPEELIAQALETFLSRNKLQGDGVAIGVPGQTALARFIQLPPVESSRVGEIVKYEARQQIPFALEEVIWDYQPLGGGIEESGFMLDAEVGLFAMKRDQVQQHLAPFLARKVEVDLVQIAPLALYNYICHDRFGLAPGSSDGGEQEDYSLVLDMGADNTTLLVTNGKKIWNRNVPLGGNHFTRALTKEMKLTFAKAEHLKCNATKSPDPKAVFQALRPVFNDYVAEIQRSIGFFSSVNRDATIGRIVGVGNGFKLAGLQKFLQQNLQMDVERVDSFQGLSGDSVLSAPLFQENLLSFAIPYGLALQGLKITRVHTSLLPPEIATARLIRTKKPWAVTTAALVLFGLATSTFGYAHVWSTVSTEKFGDAEAKAKKVIDEKNSLKKNYDDAKTKNVAFRKDLETLTAAGSGRTQWLEVFKAVNECLPRDKTFEEQEQEDPTRKNRIRILSITSKRYENLGDWYKGLDDGKKTYMRSDDKKTGPTGAGYVFTLQGRHFHDDPTDFRMREVSYVANTLLLNLKQWTVPQFNVTTRQPTGVMIPVRQMGITHPTISESQPTHHVKWFKNGPGAAAAARGGGGGAAPPAGPNAGPAKKGAKRPKNEKAKPAPGADSGGDEAQPIPQTDFVIQFAWLDTPEAKRLPADPNEKDVAAELQGGTAAGAAAQGVNPGANAANPQINGPGAPGATAMPAGAPGAAPGGLSGAGARPGGAAQPPVGGVGAPAPAGAPGIPPTGAPK